MKRVILVAAALLSSLLCLGIPAHPGTFVHVQPDGTTLTLRRVGDEWGHSIIDVHTGRTLRLDADGWYREESEASARQRRATARSRRSTAHRVRAARSGEPIAVGQKHFLVVLVEFSGLSFTVKNPQEAFRSLLNDSGYSVNGGTGSARDFYYDNSHGCFEPVFDVYGPVPLNNAYSYYGGNDSAGNDLRAEQAVIDACRKLDGDIDFSQYDNDGDGYVDMVFMYYAGYGEADDDNDDENTIWPHQWYIESGAGKTVTLDGVKLDSYACTNERIGTGSRRGTMCGIGTACHEFGHAMGLPDFYDTDYKTNGSSDGLYSYSTMCGGSYNNDGRTPPYFNMMERIMLGWKSETDLREFSASGYVTLPSIDENVAYRIPTEQEGEFFVLEARGANGWDAALPGHGLLVYHADQSERLVSISTYVNGKQTNVQVSASELWNNWMELNSINENGSHPCFYLIPAASPSSLSYSWESRIPFPYNSNNSYTPVSWDGVTSPISLSGITYASNQVSFTVTVPKEDLDYNLIANPGDGVYQAGDRFSFELVETQTRPVGSVSWYYDDEPASSASVTLTAGVHTIDAHLTLTSGVKKIVTLEITVNQ